MDEQKHWDNIAEKYQDEVLNAFESDRKQKLARYFKKHRNKKHTAIDFGCGIGNGFDYLAPNFKEVIAVDISQNCLDIAKEKGYDNITFKQKDLTLDRISLTPAEFVLCSNVAIFAELEMNYAIFRNVSKVMKPGGHALFVIPSMESTLFYAWRMIDWHRRDGVKPEDIPDSEFAYYKGSKRDLLQGIVSIDGRPTKHYYHSELQVVLREAGMEVLNIDRLEYEWTTEFLDPPKWMKDPYPWDWVVECRK